MKHLIMVCTKDTTEYASFLRALISSNDDTADNVIGTEDGTVSTAIWTEEEYLSNRNHLDTQNYFLFIGPGRKTESECKHLTVRYSEYGTEIGWLGKFGYLKVKENKLNEKQYARFCAHADKYLKTLSYKKVNLKSLPFGAAIATLFSPIIAPPVNLVWAIFYLKIIKEIKKQQYSYLVLKMYYEELKKFLEE